MRPWNEGYPVIRESAHYTIMRNPEADPRDPEAGHYLLILKEFNTIEASSPAYVVIHMHMVDAEAAYANVMQDLSKKPLLPQTASARLN